MYFAIIIFTRELKLNCESGKHLYFTLLPDPPPPVCWHTVDIVRMSYSMKVKGGHTIPMACCSVRLADVGGSTPV